MFSGSKGVDGSTNNTKPVGWLTNNAKCQAEVMWQGSSTTLRRKQVDWDGAAYIDEVGGGANQAQVEHRWNELDMGGADKENKQQ